MAVHTFSGRRVNPGTALMNPGSALLNPGSALLNPVSALQNPFLGIGGGKIFGIPVTKKARHAAAVGKETLFRNKYFECKQAKINKGKTVYPDDPKGKCKTKWKAWQKWRGKAGKRAIKVAEAAEKKGRLDPEAQAFLEADTIRSLNISPSAQLMSAQAMPDAQAEAYLEENYSVGGPPTAVYVVGGLAVVGTVAYFLLRR